MTYQTLDIRAEGAIDWLTLDRPERLNTLDPTMMAELKSYFTALRGDRRVRVVAMRGAGRAFCAGLDIKAAESGAEALGPLGPLAGLDVQRRVSDITLAMRRCPQPIVALVHGAASGGGFAMALAADIRI